jgi:hypothetical protein
MRIWLDDIRPMPKGFDLWVRNAFYLKKLIKEGQVDYISFDHDLGDEDDYNSGYAVADYIEELSFSNNIKPIAWDIHSQNPVGRYRIETAMKSAERFWNK